VNGQSVAYMHPRLYNLYQDQVFKATGLGTEPARKHHEAKFDIPSATPSPTLTIVSATPTPSRPSPTLGQTTRPPYLTGSPPNQKGAGTAHTKKSHLTTDLSRKKYRSHLLPAL
jgi:hypothetical protein